MTINVLKKKDVANLWVGQYPLLYPYSQDKLYVVLGAFVAGIELIKLPRVEEYRPHFVLYPLYGNLSGKKINDCMSYPVLLLEFFNEKGLQYSIPYKGGLSLSQESIQKIGLDISFKFGDDVNLSIIHRLIDLQINDSLVKAQFKQPEFYELKFYSALYVGNKEAEMILEEIQEASKSWDMGKFKIYYGAYKAWYENLKQTNRDIFISIIEKNKLNKKLEKLHHSELK